MDLSFDDLAQKINSDLVGKFSNIFSRTAPFIAKNNNKLAQTLDESYLDGSRSNEQKIYDLFESKNYSKAIKLIMDIADNTNKYINEKEPWKLDQDQATIVSTTAINVFKNLCILLHPVIPNITGKMLGMLHISDISNSALSNKLLDIEISEFKAILSRVEALDAKHFQSEEREMEEKTEDFINIEDFMKVDLRVAEVIAASHVEGADKLLSIKLGLGEMGEKNVFAGIKSAYEPDQLVGKLVVMVFNLAARKMKFGNSEGMILAASDSEGGIFVISPDQGAKPGQKIK